MVLSLLVTAALHITLVLKNWNQYTSLLRRVQLRVISHRFAAQSFSKAEAVGLAEAVAVL